MNGSSYTPGQWTALSCNGLVALLEPAAGDEPALELWQIAGDGGSFLDGLSVLARPGLAVLPSFVLAVRGQDGTTNVAVRGPARVEVLTDDGTELIDGTGVSTWTERVLHVVHRLTVRVPDGASTPWLPLIGGLVRAAALTVPTQSDLTGSDDPTVGRAAGAVPPEPVPVVDAEADLVDAVPASTTAPHAAALDGEPAGAPATVAEPVELTREVPDDREPDGVGAASAGAGPDSRTFDGPSREQPTQVLTRIVEPAMVGAGASAEVPGPAAGTHVAGHHDGADDASFTIMSSTLADLREGLPVWDGRPAPTPDPVRVTDARLVLSTGLVVALDRPVLIGRAPQAMRLGSRDLPRLVAVPSPQQDISRTHAEVRLVGDDVLVTDLDSTNGVYLLAAGLGARRLHPGEPTALAASETVDLGDGVTFTVERGT
ncbi:MAG: FHA domain-containing protein [Actinobacteria bacterium]|nr:FHA domain-containing protein [Actinomycetota bacterium]